MWMRKGKGINEKKSFRTSDTSYTFRSSCCGMECNTGCAWTSSARPQNRRPYPHPHPQQSSAEEVSSHGNQGRRTSATRKKRGRAMGKDRDARPRGSLPDLTRCVKLPPVKPPFQKKTAFSNLPTLKKDLPERTLTGGWGYKQQYTRKVYIIIVRIWLWHRPSGRRGDHST